MTDLLGLTLPALPAALSAPRGEPTLVPVEAEPALLDFLFAAAATTARVAAARSARGALVLETPKGQIAIPNGPDFPVGAEVEVRLAGRMPPLAALRLVAAPPSPAAGTLEAAPAVTRPAAEIVRGAPLSAVLLAAPPDEAWPIGTPRLIRILAITIPNGSQPPDRAGRGGAVLSAAESPAGVDAGEAAPARAALEGGRGIGAGVPPGRRASEGAPAGKRSAEAPANPTAERSGAVQLSPKSAAVKMPLSRPDAPAATPAAPLEEGELVGPVVTRTSSGAVIQTPNHTIAVENLDAPEGALIRFVLLDPPAEPASARPARREPWSALGEALRTLERTSPEKAARLVADLHPNDPARLAATIRLVAAALRDGGRPFPGEAVEEALQTAGRADLVPMLREEVRVLGRLAAEPQQQWQVLPLPLHDGAQLTPAYLYVERDARRDPLSGEEARRFVLDVQTRALGRLQLDGLLRPRRFDLLLRTRVPLDRTMRGEIETLFRATLDSAGWKGDVAFSTTPAFTDEPQGKYRERVAALA